METDDSTKLQIILQNLTPGDLITHTVCTGTVEEHYFVDWYGPWLAGAPTNDTLKLSGQKKRIDRTICADNLTHINRISIPELKRRKLNG